MPSFNFLLNFVALTIIIFFFGIFSLWLWMIYDCGRRKYADQSEKTLWLMTVIFTGMIIGTFLYIIFGRVKGNSPTSGNRKALYSLILADLGLCFPCVGIIFSIPSIVMGHSALKDISKTKEEGRGMALTGIILGYLPIVVVVVIIITLVTAKLKSGH